MTHRYHTLGKYLGEPPATEARLRLAVLRAEALYNFYAAERRRGLSAIEANESMSVFAKRFDTYEEAVVAREMERIDV